METIIKSINEPGFTISIVGLGYVGLPLSNIFVNSGFQVFGYDIDLTKVESLRKGNSYLKHISHDSIQSMLDTCNFIPTNDESVFAQSDAIIICVPTPLTSSKDPDLSYVLDTTKVIAKYINDDRRKLVVLESTTYPGTTRDLLLPILDNNGVFKVGKDFFLAFSPEREDPGRKDIQTHEIPKVVGGVDDNSCVVATHLYRKGFKSVVPVSSSECAESTKLLENIYRSVNIALVNELKIIFSKMNVDIWEVIEAASTKPFGFQPFYPGPGLGGHCIPIDPFYLTWKAKELGLCCKFIELSGQINTYMPTYVIDKIMLALNDKGKSVKNSKILILGLAYKPDIDDTRESPSFELIDGLIKLGALVDYNDPYILEMPKVRKHNFDMSSKDLEHIGDYDCVVISTNHSYYDWNLIKENSRLIVDTRGVFSKSDMLHYNIVRA